MSKDQSDNAHMNRRRFFGKLTRGLLGAGLAGAAAAALSRAAQAREVWQIDPFKCVQCGQCRTHCVLEDSAVKCVHDFSMCGYCLVCTGFFHLDATRHNEGAENQLCPLGAITRRFVEGENHEYTIDETLCTGCGQCVKGCAEYGNGSLYLQVRHDRCLNCNQCSIAAACPADAFIRLPAETPYVVKSVWIARGRGDTTQRFRLPEFESGYVRPKFLEKRGGPAQ